MAALVAAWMLGASCNDDWDTEQYTQYVSLKAPSNNSTVAQIRLKYRQDTLSRYRLPLIVSGSTMNQKDLDVHVVLDKDTLEIYNKEHYYNRTDLYFHQLDPAYYTIANSTVHIPAGECQGYLDIDFNFENLDLSDKYVLPLVIKDDPSYNYQSHPRKDYNNALLWITPFNDFSGTYGSTNLSVYTEKSNKPIITSTRESYVVDANSIFFYAGATQETRPDRKFFKVFARFNPETDESGTVTLYTDNPDLKLNVIGTPTYKITSVMDNSRPSLLRRTVTIQMEYTYEDPLETPDYTVKYSVKGSMSMQRNINTLIPDEEYAIEW